MEVKGRKKEVRERGKGQRGVGGERERGGGRENGKDLLEERCTHTLQLP